MITHGIAKLRADNKKEPSKVEAILKKVLSLKGSLDAIEVAASSMNAMKAEQEKIGSMKAEM